MDFDIIFVGWKVVYPVAFKRSDAYTKAFVRFDPRPISNELVFEGKGPDQTHATVFGSLEIYACPMKGEQLQDM